MLVAWYTLDNFENRGIYGGSLSNSSPANITSIQNGKVAGCYNFNGVGYLSSVDEIPAMAEVTYCAWVRWTNSAVSAQGIVNNFRHTGASGYNTSFCVNSAGRLRLDFPIKDGTSHTAVIGNAILTQNAWTHVACSVNHFTGDLSFYINGVLDKRSTISSTYLPIPIKSEKVMIGQWGWSYTTSYKYIGQIDDVRIYDHALSPKEVKELAKAKVLHYKMDQFAEPTENLIAGSSVSDYRNRSNNNSIYPIEDEEYGEHRRLRRNPDFSTYPSSTLSCYTSLFYDTTPGETYTQSMEVRPDADITLRLHSSGDRIFCPAGMWTTLTRTVIPSGESVRFQGLYATGLSADHNPWIEYRNGMVEKGSFTEYTPDFRLGTVHDSSGYDNHAELALATTPRWVGSESSKIGSGAYEFSRTIEQHINAGNSSYFNITEDLTLSAWIKYTGYSGGVISKGLSGGWVSNSYMLLRSQRFYITDGSNGKYLTFPSLDDGKWHHIAGTTSKSENSIKIYVDGELYAESTRNIGDIQATSANLVIGQGYSSTWWDGSIDDVRIYATALSDEDILELYQTRGSIDSHGNLYVQDIIETGHKPLVMDYTIWEGGQTGAIGAFGVYGNGNRRILGYDPWGKETVLWESYSNSPSGAGGIYFSSSTPVDNTKMYRMSWWEKRVSNGTGNYCRYYAGMNGYGSTNGVYYRSSGSLTTNPYFWNSSTIPSQSQLPLGEWVLVVGHVWPAGSGTGDRHPDSGRYTTSGRLGEISYDFVWHETTNRGRSRTLAVYRTGDAGDSTGAIHHTVYPRIDVCDGSEPSIQDLLSGFDSRHIDYVRSKGGSNPITIDIGDQSSIFGTISELGPTVGLIAYYPLDGNANDYSGNNNHGTNSGATVTSGIRGSAYSFSSASTKITLPDDVGYTDQVSAFAWFKSSGVPGGGYHIIFGGAQLELSITSAGVLRAGVYMPSRYVSNHGSGLTDGNWHHVGLTIGGAKKITYIDGVRVGSQDIAGSITSVFSYRTIGVYGNNSSYWANGSISNARIYNRVLSPEEIKILYDVTKPNAIPMQLSKDGTVYLAGQLQEV